MEVGDAVSRGRAADKDPLGGKPPVSKTPTVRFALSSLGFTLFYSVAVVFFYYEWLFAAGLPADPLAYAAVLNISLLAAAVVEWRILPRLRSGRGLAVAGALAYTAAFALLSASGGGMGAAAVYGAGACSGVGAALTASLWLDRLGCLSGKGPAYVLGIASLASIPVSVLVGLLPIFPMVAVCAVMTAGSYAALAGLGATRPFGAERAPGAGGVLTAEGTPAVEGNPGSAGSPRGAGLDWVSGGAPSVRSRLAVPFAYVAILSFVYGTLDDVAMAGPSVLSDDSGIISQVCSVVTVAIFLSYVRSGDRRFTALLNVAVGIVATGLVFLPFLGYGYNLLLMVLTHIGWELSLLVSYALAVEEARGGRRRLLGIGALAFAAPRPFVVAGSCVVDLIVGAGSGGAANAEGGAAAGLEFAHMVVIACALLYVTLFAIWLLTNREKRRAERDLARRNDVIRRFMSARDDLYALACGDLAREHGLTNRELDVLRLLAQGRDAGTVEQELGLSRNTVKSYTKSLYAKLGVHSKQDVIDVVRTRTESCVQDRAM